MLYTLALVFMVHTLLKQKPIQNFYTSHLCFVSSLNSTNKPRDYSNLSWPWLYDIRKGDDMNILSFMDIIEIIRIYTI